MDFLRSLNISGTGLTAQKFRMDIIAQNLSNADVTRTEDGSPYRRKMVVLQSQPGSFQDALNKASGNSAAGGVVVKRVVEDPSDLVPVYNPGHPDADADGYVQMPNVNTAQEMVDMLAASRAYEANVTAFNATKAMILKALEIGR